MKEQAALSGSCFKPPALPEVSDFSVLHPKWRGLQNRAPVRAKVGAGWASRLPFPACRRKHRTCFIVILKMNPLKDHCGPRNADHCRRDAHATRPHRIHVRTVHARNDFGLSHAEGQTRPLAGTEGAETHGRGHFLKRCDSPIG